MCPWCGRGMWGGGMMILWLIVFVVIIVAAWMWLARSRPSREPDTDDAERILHERFARGEIDEPTYQHMLAELRRERWSNP